MRRFASVIAFVSLSKTTRSGPLSSIHPCPRCAATGVILHEKLKGSPPRPLPSGNKEDVAPTLHFDFPPISREGSSSGSSRTANGSGGREWLEKAGAEAQDTA